MHPKKQLIGHPYPLDNKATRVRRPEAGRGIVTAVTSNLSLSARRLCSRGLCRESRRLEASTCSPSLEMNMMSGGRQAMAEDTVTLCSSCSRW